MKTIQIRNITIGEGRPKICVPVVGQTEEDILREAAGFASLPVDVVEWRADWFQDVLTLKKSCTRQKLCVLFSVSFLFFLPSARQRKVAKKKFPLKLTEN